MVMWGVKPANPLLSSLPSNSQRSKISLRVFEIICSIIEGVEVAAAGAFVQAALSLFQPWRAAVASNVIALEVGVGYILLAWILGEYPRRRAALHDIDLIGAVKILGAALVCLVLFQPLLFGWSIFGLIAAFIWFALAIAAIGFTRNMELLLAPRLISPRYLRRLAVIVGSGPGALHLLQMIGAQRFQDYEFVGYFDDRQSRGETLQGSLRFLGDLDSMIEFVEDHDELDVFMALPWTAGKRIAQLLDRLRFLPVVVRLAPDPDVAIFALDQSVQAESILLPTLMTPPFSQWGRFCKYILDMTLGLILLAAVSPILIAVAVAIKLDSPGPVFFSQFRNGQYGRKFSILKFRSLHVAKADAEAVTLVTKGDSRVTRIGHYIRKYSLDELPQIINVLRGDMSLIGPRPHAPKAKAGGRLYADVVPSYPLRYRVKPGMTGWAQINGWRGETDTEEKLRKRVEFDFYYITHWSFWLDIQILFRSISAMILPKNNA
jgi:Undecaprenyl-phosphate glucose phosphotransferase